MTKHTNLGVPKIGWEVQELYLHAEIIDKDRPSHQWNQDDDVFVPSNSGSWAFKTDDSSSSSKFRSFEFITRPFLIDEVDVIDREKSIRAIMKCIKGYTQTFWRYRKTKEKSKPVKIWNLKNTFTNSFVLDKWSYVSRTLNQHFFSLPERFGVNSSKAVKWKTMKEKGFKVDEIIYAIPKSECHVQMTIGASSERLYSIVKAFSLVDGLGFSRKTLRNFVKVCDETINQFKINDKHAQSFIFLVCTYISGARAANLPSQMAYEIYGFFYFLHHGHHFAQFDFGKRFSEVGGILSRTNFADMFNSLPKITQAYLKSNIWEILGHMFYDDGGHEIFDEPLIKYGFRTNSPGLPTNYFHRMYISLFFPNDYIETGPLIKDWINGFMYSNKDLLKGGIFTSMGQMDLDGGLWLMEFRRSTIETKCFPVECKDKGIRAIALGFANIFCASEYLRFLQTGDIDEILSMTKADANQRWDDLLSIHKRKFISEEDEDLVRAEAYSAFSYNVDDDVRELIELWIRRHF